eukprot:6460380-Alexandrium_andersonii.AAC.1
MGPLCFGELPPGQLLLLSNDPDAANAVLESLERVEATSLSLVHAREQRVGLPTGLQEGAIPVLAALGRIQLRILGLLRRAALPLLPDPPGIVWQ